MSRILTIIKDQVSTTYYYDENKNLHRENGPAIESKKQNKWFIHGEEVEPSQKMIQQYNDYLNFHTVQTRKCKECNNQ